MRQIGNARTRWNRQCAEDQAAMFVGHRCHYEWHVERSCEVGNREQPRQVSVVDHQPPIRVWRRELGKGVHDASNADPSRGYYR